MFADAGIDASRAGTALNSILSQFSNPASSDFFHRLFGAKVNRSGWAGFHTGWFLADTNAIDAQGTFVHPVVIFVHARHIERATGDAVTTTDTVL